MSTAKSISSKILSKNNSPSFAVSGVNSQYSICRGRGLVNPLVLTAPSGLVKNLVQTLSGFTPNRACKYINYIWFARSASKQTMEKLDIPNGDEWTRNGWDMFVGQAKIEVCVIAPEHNISHENVRKWFIIRKFLCKSLLNNLVYVSNSFTRIIAPMSSLRRCHPCAEGIPAPMPSLRRCHLCADAIPACMAPYLQNNINPYNKNYSRR